MEWTAEQERRKRVFLANNLHEYGYGDQIDNIRKDFAHLKGGTYLDHAGATLYSESQLRNVLKDLTTNIYGNPHSHSPSGHLSSKRTEEVRKSILEMFNTSPSQYSVIFTSGCSAALKIVGECFPWNKESHFYHLTENHNSVLGIREYAAQHRATIHPISPIELPSYIESVRSQENDLGNSLLALPAENNFSGTKTSLQFLKKLKENSNGSKCRVLLDAAAFVGTARLDLTEYPADFVTISFYKMFGYPTGIGALIVKNDAAKLLRKTYFGGGTVAAALSTEQYHVFRSGISEKFEDGTASFLSIASLKYGLDIIKDLNIENITSHTHSLIQHLYTEMKGLFHENGKPVCVVYGDHHLNDSAKQGPILAFNLLRPNGQWVGYNEVEQLATLSNIHLRTGCFCNPGSCHSYLNLSNEEVKKNLEAGHICWDDKDIMNGKPTGAIRISLGYMSNWEDIEIFVEFIKKYFVNSEPTSISTPLPNEAVAPTSPSQQLFLESIYLYPIKSCGRFEVSQWEITTNGLLYDREWVLIDANGNYLNQKKALQLCLIRPTINLGRKIMRIEAPGMSPLELSLSRYPAQEKELKVCGDSCIGFQYSEEVNEWFSAVLRTECYLVRMAPVSNRISNGRDTKARIRRGEQLSQESLCPIAFSNESQFLVVSKASVEDVASRVKNSGFPIVASGFRPNFVVGGGLAYQEDNWKSISIGDQHLNITALCNRCKMICIDQETGAEGQEPLLTLAAFRRSNGRIYFGAHSEHNKQESAYPYLISCGSPINVHSTEERKL